MITSLYKCFQHWSETGSVYIFSDTHFDDSDCKLMDPEWISPLEQVQIINDIVKKNDTLILLGDVGNPEYLLQIKSKYNILIMGNHDKGKKNYEPYFDEIYEGPLFISDKILLSHEPIKGLDFCFNIHGHDHNKENIGDANHLNLAANVHCYMPVSLGALIKEGLVSKINNIHRHTIDWQTEHSLKKEKQYYGTENDLH